MTVTHSIAPVYDENSHTLILGTMPSPVSRDVGFYYMHPQNRFWQVMARVIGEKLQYKNDGSFFEKESCAKESCANGACSKFSTKNANSVCDTEAAIAERKAMMLRYGFALWDVLASCDITGASDSSIKNAVTNDIASLLPHTQIKRVFTTGQTAHKYYTRLCQPQTQIVATCLPSTSPANAKWTLDLLAAKYMEELAM